MTVTIDITHDGLVNKIWTVSIDEFAKSLSNV